MFKDATVFSLKWLAPETIGRLLQARQRWRERRL